MNNNESAVSYHDLIIKMEEKKTAAKSIKLLGENIEVKTVLSLTEFDSALSNMVTLMYDENGEYNPGAKDFVVRLCTVFAYTGVMMPEDLNAELGGLYDLMYGTNFYDDVVRVIDSDQYAALLSAFEDETGYRNQSNIDRVTRQVDELAAMIEGLGEQFRGIIGDVSEEDVQKLIGAIENNQIDEGKLVKALAAEKANEE